MKDVEKGTILRILIYKHIVLHRCHSDNQIVFFYVSQFYYIIF